jgi:hypothetical protein
MADVQGSLTAIGERALRTIEVLEVEKARVEARLLAAYGALHTVECQQVETLALTAGSLHVSADRVVAEEIALATGVGIGEVTRRLSLATAPRRHRTFLAALRSGTTTLHRALQVASETTALSDADVAAVEEAVLAPSRDGRPLSQRTFVTRLRRAIASVDDRGSDERRAHARSRRGVFGRLTHDGMGCLTLVADADAIAAVMDRLDGQARAARGAGDPRTLDQLRCDLATEALLRSHLDASHTVTHATSGTTADSGSGCASRPGGTAATGGPESPGPGSALTGQPAGLVWLIVPFEVATGTSGAACELPGHGWVTAAHAREIMTRPGSAWRTLPVDLRTGEALARPTKAYRPSAALVEHVQAVDGRCRGPGCEVVASRCDLDHETPWPEGGTTADNLYSKHRPHHNLKTDGVWTSAPVADRGLEWTTLTGRTYVTYPKDWREGVDPPDLGAPPAPAPTDGEPPPF